MSFLTVLPDMVATSAENLVDVCSTLGVANAAAAVSTTGIAAAASDEVSTAIATLFGSYAQEYQTLSARAAAFHDEFVSVLKGSGAAYLSAEVANAEQNLIKTVNAPARALLGHPLIPTDGSATAGPGTGVIGTAGLRTVDAVATAVRSGANATLGRVTAAESVVAASATRVASAATLLPGHVAASVESVSASLPASLASLSLLGSTAAPAAQATVDIAAPYQELIENTAANLQSLGSTWAANPAPFLSQILANQLGYGQTIATSLQNAAQDLGAVLYDPSALNRALADLSPISAIGGQIQQNLINLGGTALTDVAPAVAFVAAGPALSTLQGFGISLNAFTTAVQSGDIAGALGALVDAPAVLANGFLNGGVTLPLLLPIGLGFVVLDVPFDGILVAPHATTATVTWFLPYFQEVVSGPTVGGIVSTLLTSVPQELATAITPA